MPGQKHEEGMDILKFFIGVMSLLTVLVAGFAGYNWSKATTLEEEVDAAQENLRNVEKIAGNPDFKKAVARSKMEKLVDTRTADLPRFLTDAATLQRFTLKSLEPVGGAAGLGQQGFIKKSYKLVIERQPLEVIADYLFNIQANWPGLKIEELSVKEITVKAGEAFPGWQSTILVSTFRPKD